MHSPWLLNTSSIKRSQVFLEEWLVVGLGQGKNKMTLNNLVVIENKYSKSDRDMSIGHTSQLEGALTGQVQENKNKNINKKLDGNSMNIIRIHEFTLI